MLIAPALIVLAASPAADPPPVPRTAVGGGTTQAGFLGQFFANPDLQGEPAFSRRDVRVRFDWGTDLPILGVVRERLRGFPRDGFSVRWSGQLVPRFSERYTLSLTSDERARLRLRPAGTTAWQNLIDAWQAHPRRTDTATCDLTAGSIYDIEIDYSDLAGEAACILRWSSPSTPDEVIDPLATGQIHGPNGFVFANGADCAAWQEKKGDKGADPLMRVYKFPCDAQGWPSGDFKTDYIQGCKSGGYTLIFRGQATVEIPPVKTFTAGGKQFQGKVPAGAGWDPATNTTRIDFQFGSGAPKLFCSDTRRTPDSPVGSGITDIQFLKPVRAGDKQACEPGAILTDASFVSMAPYIMFRWQGTAFPPDREWKHRLPREYERLIGAANELGKDIMLCFGASSNPEYMEKLARLVQFGSDGLEPYAKPTPDPVWPPLNSNLRIYLEHGNEMGWSAIQPKQWGGELAEYAKADHPIWKAVNYDGTLKDAGSEAMYRYHAWRTAQQGLAFRRIAGDAAMHERVRPVLFGFYQNPFQSQMCAYLDGYFNGPQATDPHPVSHYIWGAGPALYYGTDNQWGRIDDDPIADRDFALANLKPGVPQAAPAGLKWSFTGSAGVLDVRLPRRHLTVARGEPAQGGKRWVGCRFTVSEPLSAIAVGRLVRAGESGEFEVMIFNEDGKPLLNNWQPEVAVKKAKQDGEVFIPTITTAWITSDSHRCAPRALEPGKTYILASLEPTGGFAKPVAATAPPGITVQAAVARDGDGAFTEVAGGAVSAGPALLNLVAPLPELGAPADDASPDSAYAKDKADLPATAAYLHGTGSFEQAIAFPRTDEYGISFWACSTDENPLTITIDGTEVWNKTVPKGSRKPSRGWYQYSTRPIKLEAGTHTVRFAGTKAKMTTLVTRVSTISIEAFYGGEKAMNFMGSGEATGQTASRVPVVYRSTCEMARIWGLVPCSYEGNWSLGGDWNGDNVMHFDYTKYEHPWTIQAHTNILRFWAAMGGFDFAHYYPVWEGGVENAPKVPIQKAVIAMADQFLEPTHGHRLPGELTPALDHYSGKGWSLRMPDFKNTGDAKKAAPPQIENGGWKAWVVLSPTTATYTVSATANGGGTIQLTADDCVPIATGTGTATGTVRLTKGQHSIKVRAAGGDLTPSHITISAP
jgi:hypothetical protein